MADGDGSSDLYFITVNTVPHGNDKAWKRITTLVQSVLKTINPKN